MVHGAPHYFDLTLNCYFQDLRVYKHECICIIFLLIPLNHCVSLCCGTCTSKCLMYYVMIIDVTII